MNKQKKHILGMGLTKKMTIRFSLVSIAIIMCISSIIVVYSVKIIKKSLLDVLELSIVNNTGYIDGFFSRIDLMMEMIQRRDSYFIKSLNSFEDDLVEDIKQYGSLKEQLKNNADITLTKTVSNYTVMFFVDEDIPLARIFPNAYKDVYLNKNAYTSVSLYNDNGIKENEWFQKTVQMDGDYNWFRMDNDENMLCVSKLVKCPVQDEHGIGIKEVGVMFISFDTSWIDESIEKSTLTDGLAFLLSDKSGNIAFSNSSFEGYEKNLDDVLNSARRSDNLIYENQLHADLNLVAVIPSKNVNKIVSVQAVIIVMVTLLLVMISILFVFFVSHSIVRPINIFSEYIKTNSDLKPIPCDGIADDEIGVMYNNYNYMIDQINDLIQKVYQIEYEKQKTKINMLQAQINPHFIYNVLNSICCVALTRGQTDIADTLSILTDIMRYTIKDPDIIVPVTKELEIIKSFIIIQKFKYGDLIDIECNIPHECEKISLPKMLIQPLVENCIYHGMEHIGKSKLMINITAEEEGSDVIITVYDNGRKVDVESINLHLKGIKTISGGTGGLGIRNVDQRIKMTFGEDYGLHYEAMANGGMKAIIKIPRI